MCCADVEVYNTNQIPFLAQMFKKLKPQNCTSRPISEHKSWLAQYFLPQYRVNLCP